MTGKVDFLRIFEFFRYIFRNCSIFRDFFDIISYLSLYFKKMLYKMLYMSIKYIYYNTY